MVQQALGIECVHLLPCRVPPHRAAPVASPEQRLALLRAALDDEPALAIDERELQREGPSYMVDTLEAVRRDCGAQPLCLALGMDAFAGLEGHSDPVPPGHHAAPRHRVAGSGCHRRVG